MQMSSLKCEDLLYSCPLLVIIKTEFAILKHELMDKKGTADMVKIVVKILP